MKDLHTSHLLPWLTHITFFKPCWSYSSYLSPSSLLTNHPRHYSLSKRPHSILRADLFLHSVNVGSPSKALSLGGFLFTSIFWDIPSVQRLTPTCWVNSVQFSSVTQSCLTLCNPMDCSMPGLPANLLNVFVTTPDMIADFSKKRNIGKAHKKPLPVYRKIPEFPAWLWHWNLLGKIR